MAGLLVNKDFNYEFVQIDDLSAHTPLHVVGLSQQLHVPFAAKPHVLVAVVRHLFADVVEHRRPPAAAELGAGGGGGVQADPPHGVAFNDHVAEDVAGVLVVCGGGVRLGVPMSQQGGVRVTLGPPGRVTLDWEATPTLDLVADAIVSAAMHAQSSPHALAMTSKLSSATAAAADDDPLAGDLCGPATPPPPSALDGAVPMDTDGEAALLSSPATTPAAVERALLRELQGLLRFRFDSVELVACGVSHHGAAEAAGDASAADGGLALRVDSLVRGRKGGASVAGAAFVRWVPGSGLQVDAAALPPAADPAEVEARAGAARELTSQLERAVAGALVALGPVRQDAARVP